MVLKYLFKRLHYSSSFGLPFYLDEKNQYVRMFNFSTPQGKFDGKYLTYFDKKIGFLFTGNKQIQHFLPSRRYPVSRLWMLNGETFYYLKQLKNDLGEVYYLLDKVQLKEY